MPRAMLCILDSVGTGGAPDADKYGDVGSSTGKPIRYTSIDSVFQIAAHESHFGLERLYEASSRLLAAA